MNRFKVTIFLLTTNLSWWLMKQKSELTVSTVSIFLKLNFLEWTHTINISIEGLIPRIDRSSNSVK